MDILKYIWSVQKEFNKNFVDFENLDNQQGQSMTKEYVLHTISELNELLNEVNWKVHHKKNSVEINRRELVLEWIDVFKYWLSIGLLWDITPEEFVKAFDEKSGLVEQRYLQEFADLNDKQIVVCDIDGVLGDYPETFLNYVRSQEFESKSIYPDFDSKNVTSYNLYKYLDGIVDTRTLKEYKKSYRESGEIRSEKVNQGAVEFLKKLKSKGYYVVLLTSRPFGQYKNLYLDTYVWLKNNGLEFDMLLNDSKKRDKIIKLTETSTIKFIIDDDPEIIKGLLNLEGVNKLYLVDKPYNSSSHFNSKKVSRVLSFEEILEKEGIK